MENGGATQSIPWQAFDTEDLVPPALLPAHRSTSISFNVGGNVEANASLEIQVLISCLNMKLFSYTTVPQKYMKDHF